MYVFGGGASGCQGDVQLIQWAFMLYFRHTIAVIKAIVLFPEFDEMIITVIRAERLSARHRRTDSFLALLEC